MSTLAEVLTAGNIAAGQVIYMGTGMGTGGNTLHMELGTIDGIAMAQITPGGTITFGDDTGTLQMQGSTLSLGAGAGTGGGLLHLDGATLDMGTLPALTPADPITVAAWIPISMNGTDYLVPAHL
jgi:hypothetical protein